MSVAKLPIPDVPSVDPGLRAFLEPVKIAIEQIGGRRGMKVAQLTRNATTGDLVNKVNELIELLQDTPVPDGPGLGARASEWASFTPSATGDTSGSGTVQDNGCVWRVADRLVHLFYDVTLTSVGTISGHLSLSFPNEVPLPRNAVAYGYGREIATTGSALTAAFSTAKGRRVRVQRYDDAVIATNDHRYTLHVRWPTS